jgi:hypothetical protein
MLPTDPVVVLLQVGATGPTVFPKQAAAAPLPAKALEPAASLVQVASSAFKAQPVPFQYSKKTGTGSGTCSDPVAF